MHAEGSDARGQMAQLLAGAGKYPMLGPFWQRVVNREATREEGPSMEDLIVEVTEVFCEGHESDPV